MTSRSFRLEDIFHTQQFQYATMLYQWMQTTWAAPRSCTQLPAQLPPARACDVKNTSERDKSPKTCAQWSTLDSTQARQLPGLPIPLGALTTICRVLRPAQLHVPFLDIVEI